MFDDLVSRLVPVGQLVQERCHDHFGDAGDSSSQLPLQELQGRPPVTRLRVPAKVGADDGRCHVQPEEDMRQWLALVLHVDLVELTELGYGCDEFFQKADVVTHQQFGVRKLFATSMSLVLLIIAPSPSWCPR